VSDRELLARVIDASGLSRRRYAERVLARDERTLRRWLSGDTPIPLVVVEYLQRHERAVLAAGARPR